MDRSFEVGIGGHQEVAHGDGGSVTQPSCHDLHWVVLDQLCFAAGSQIVEQACPGDKGYNVERVRDWLRDHGIAPVIARKDNEKLAAQESFDQEAYRERNFIERRVGWLNGCRRFGTRFEKLAVHWAAMIQLAITKRYLKA